MDIRERLTSALNWLNLHLGDSIKFSFSWLSRPEDRILFIKLFAVQLVSTIILVLTLAFIVGATQLKGNVSIALLSSGVVGLLVYLLVTLTIALIVAYFQPLAFLSAMKTKGLPAVKWGPGKFVALIALAISEQLTALLCWFNREWLMAYVPLVLSIAMFVLSLLAGASEIRGMMALAALVLFVLSFIPLFVVWTYNQTRVSLCMPIFLSREGCGIMEALEGSWNLTEGRVLELFSVYFLFGILLTLLSLLLLPLSFGTAMIEVVEKLIYGVGIVSTAIDQVLNMLLVLFGTFCTFSLIVALYEIVKKEKCGKAKKA